LGNCGRSLGVHSFSSSRYALRPGRQKLRVRPTRDEFRWNEL
jgi:hypothetical protein